MNSSTKQQHFLVISSQHPPAVNRFVFSLLFQALLIGFTSPLQESTALKTTSSVNGFPGRCSFLSTKVSIKLWLRFLFRASHQPFVYIDQVELWRFYLPKIINYNIHKLKGILRCSSSHGLVSGVAKRSSPNAATAHFTHNAPCPCTEHGIK